MPVSVFAADSAFATGLAAVEASVVTARINESGIIPGKGGLVVVVESRVKEPFVVQSYKVLLDGKTILQKKAGKKGDDVISFEELPTGGHKVKVKARYTGSGYGVFDYHSDYKYTADGEFDIVIKEGRVITLKVVCNDRDGFLADLEKRPFINFETGSYTAPASPAKADVSAGEMAAAKAEDKPLEPGRVRGKYATGISVEKIDDSLKVHVVGDGTFDRYEAFRLNDPERIVVDIFGIKELIANDSLKVQSPYLTKVRVGQHEERARVVLDIPSKAPRKYSVEPSAKGLSILVGKGVSDAGKTMTAAAGRKRTPTGGNVITGISVEAVKESLKLIISGEGALGRHEAFLLEKPDRLVIDIMGAKEVLEADSLKVQSSFLEKVRIGEHEDRSRVVLDLKDNSKVEYKINVSGKALIVDLIRKK